MWGIQPISPLALDSWKYKSMALSPAGFGTSPEAGNILVIHQKVPELEAYSRIQHGALVQ